MKLNDLKPKRGSKRKKVIIGRGGKRGTYSGRGGKGQTARTGHKLRPGFEGGRTALIEQIPKLRGFNRKDLKEEIEVINVGDLEKRYKTGEKVSFTKGKYGVKILGGGELTKKLKVEADYFSKSAEEKIVKAGGEVIKLKSKVSPEKNKEKK